MSSIAEAALLIHRTSLIRRISCVRNCLSRGWFNPCRTFSDKTLTQTPTSDEDISSGSQVNRERERRRAVPQLMVFSEESPRSCSFFSLSRSIKDGIDQNFLNFDREVEIPEAAASDENLCLGSTEGIVFTQHRRTGIFGFDPLAGTPFPLPPFSTLRYYPSPDDDGTDYYFDDGKIVLSPARDLIVLPRLFIADIARLGCGGGGDSRWEELPTYEGYFHDVIFHKGLLYGLDYHGAFGIYDFEGASFSEPFYSSAGGNEPLKSESKSYYRSCLVESPDGQDLFLVYRQRKRTASWTKYFRVFKLNKEGKWERVRNIGDVAIFVGINQSVSVRASEFPHILKPNSIYFTESHDVYLCRYDLQVRDTGVFSLDDKSIQFLQLTKGQDVVDWPGWPPAVWYIPPTPS